MLAMRTWLHLLCCAFVSVLFATSSVAAGPKEGQAAPAATLKTLNGEAVDVAALKGDVVILAFWATWCQYCRQELSDLADYYREHREQGLRVYAISADDAADIDKVKARARDYPFPVVAMADADVSRYGRVWRLPLTFVIDRVGILRRDGWGNTPAVTRAQLDEMVTPLLRAKD